MHARFLGIFLQQVIFLLPSSKVSKTYEKRCFIWSETNEKIRNLIYGMDFSPKMRWKTNQDFEYFALMYSISIRFTHYASLE